MRRWVPLTVCLLTCALLAGSVYAAERVGLPAPDRGAAATYVPEDGFASYVSVDSGGAVPAIQVVESARGNGLTLLQALTFVFGAVVQLSLGDDREEARAWRTTTTTITASADRTAQPAASFYRVDGAVQLIGENEPGRGRGYQPGLVELPVDVAPGMTWTGHGDVLTGRYPNITRWRYASTYRAEAMVEGCLPVTGEVAYADENGRSRDVERHRKLWCPGRGLVEHQRQVGAAVTTTTTTRTVPPPADPPARTTTSPPLRWSDPARWSVTTFQTGTVDPNFGDYPQMAASYTFVPPVVTASGDLYRAQQSGDIVGLSPQIGEFWRSTARMHPGGSVLSLAGFGDVLVATTSRRQAVGYTADGIRLWTLDLPEIANVAAVRVSDTDAVVSDIGGGLHRVDVRTGKVRWAQSVGFDVELPPTVGGDRIVVTDRGGRQTAYAAAAGERLWRTERTAEATAYGAGLLFSVDRDAIEAIDPTDGSVRWRRVADGTFSELVTVGDRAVVATDQATWVYGPDGTEVARLPAYVQLTVAPGYVIGWTRTAAEARTADGRRLAEWTPPVALFTQTIPQPVAAPDGVRLTYLTWQLDIWGAAG